MRSAQIIAFVFATYESTISLLPQPTFQPLTDVASDVQAQMAILTNLSEQNVAVSTVFVVAMCKKTSK